MDIIVGTAILHTSRSTGQVVINVYLSSFAALISIPLIISYIYIVLYHTLNRFAIAAHCRRGRVNIL